MLYKVSDIKHDVRIILAENEDIVPFLAVEDFEAPGSLATERDILTEAMILTAANNVHGVAPREMLFDVSKKITTGAETVEKYGGYSRIGLPSDFMRLVLLDSSSWDVPATESTDIASEAYMQLHSRFEGIRACKDRPAVAIKYGADGIYAEAYPSVEAFTLYYIDYKKVEGEDPSVNVAADCYDAFKYLVASLYYTSIKEDDMAKVMENQCKALLGINTGE